MWLPDLVITSGANDFDLRTNWEDTYVKVHHTGYVLWQLGGRTEIICDVNLKFYPFDYQLCLLTITSWAHTQSTISFVNETDKIGLNFYRGSNIWNVVTTKSSSITIMLNKEQNQTLILNSICLKRKSLYFIVNLIIPCVAMSILAAFGFIIPSESGEKLSFQITVILSFTVFQLKVADSVPENGVSTPIICE